MRKGLSCFSHCHDLKSCDIKSEWVYLPYSLRTGVVNHGGLSETTGSQVTMCQQSETRERTRSNGVQGLRPAKAPSCSDPPPSAGSTTFQNSTVKWESNVQMQEPVGDVSHSNRTGMDSSWHLYWPEIVPVVPSQVEKARNAHSIS